MPTPPPLPSPFSSRPFSTREALAHRVTPRVLRSPGLHTPFFGVRSVAPVTTAVAAAHAYATSMAPDARLSHVTAAALWGLPLPRRLSDSAEVHVTLPGSDRSVRARNVIGHRSSTSGPPEYVEEIRVSDPLETWASLGPFLTIDELIAAGDAVCDPYGLASTRDDLAAEIGRVAGRRGLAKVRRAFVDVREGSRSPQETALRLALVRAGARMPFLNAEVHSAAGVFLGQADLVYGRERLAIEYEGDHHRTDRDQWHKDLGRSERFADDGWRMMRVAADEARRGFITTTTHVIRLLTERGQELNRPSAPVR